MEHVIGVNRLGKWFQERRLRYRQERYDEFVIETWIATTCQDYFTRSPNKLIVDGILALSEWQSAMAVCDLADMLSEPSLA